MFEKPTTLNVDFGKAAADYRRHRAGFPPELLTRLHQRNRPYIVGLDVGFEAVKIDLGEGEIHGCLKSLSMRPRRTRVAIPVKPVLALWKPPRTISVKLMTPTIPFVGRWRATRPTHLSSWVFVSQQSKPSRSMNGVLQGA